MTVPSDIARPFFFLKAGWTFRLRVFPGPKECFSERIEVSNRKRASPCRNFLLTDVDPSTFPNLCARKLYWSPNEGWIVAAFPRLSPRHLRSAYPKVFLDAPSLTARATSKSGRRPLPKRPGFEVHTDPQGNYCESPRGLQQYSQRRPRRQPAS